MSVGEWILYITELLGTVAFALSGAMVGVRKDLDLLGIVVLGVTTAVGGGAIRDIVLGHTPPVMFLDSIYVLLAFVTVLILFLFLNFVGDRFQKFGAAYSLILFFADSVGLGVFATSGVRTALEAGFGDQTFLALFVGVITGVGGGILRDMMANEIPMVLKRRIYAVAALAGAWLYYALVSLGMNELAATYLGTGSIIAIRMLAAKFEWNLPRVQHKI